MSIIKAGDVVQLISGGPLMTAVSTNGDAVRCQWFDEKKELKSADFSQVTLEKRETDLMIGGMRPAPV